jgi:Protein of unknown function (DUF3829)
MTSVFGAKSMSKRLLTFVPILIGALAYTGYALYKEGFIGSPPVAAQRKASGIELPAADRALRDKLQPFIACINRVDNALRESIPAYRGHFATLTAKLASPPSSSDKFAALKVPLVIPGTGFRQFKIAVFEQNNTFSLECAGGLDKAAALVPADATLDRLAVTYAKTLRDLIPLMNDADLYYDQKDHIDDKMAKGRKLHGELQPLFETLLKTSAEMRAAVTERDDRLQDSRLVAIEQQRGKSLDWQTLNVMIEARKTLAGLEARSAALSKDTVAQMEQRLQAAFDGARTIAALQPQPTGNAPKPLWFSLESNVASVLAAVKDLRREIDGGKDQRELSLAANRVVTAYNSLVRNHNMIGRFQ